MRSNTEGYPHNKSIVFLEQLKIFLLSEPLLSKYALRIFYYDPSFLLVETQKCDEVGGSTFDFGIKSSEIYIIILNCAYH